MPGPWEKYQQAAAAGPWVKYQAVAMEKPSAPARVANTKVESAFRGAVQGASMGFADELVGAVKAGGARALGLDDGSAGGLVESYKKYRDQERIKNEQARRDNPVSYLGGEVAGSIGTSFVPGMGWINVAKGASLASKVGTAAKAGALIGAGTSNADLTEGRGKELVKDVAQGAATGAAVQGVLSGVGKVASGVAARFKNVPENRAVKAVTGQNISALRQIADTTLKKGGDVGRAQERISKVGRDILDEPGVLNALDKVEDIAPKLAGAREKYGKLIGGVGKQIDEVVPEAVDAKAIGDKILAYAESIPGTEAGKKLQGRLAEEAANFEKIGRFTFGEAQKFKNQFNYKPVDADALISNQDATNKIRNIISKEMEDTVENIANSGKEGMADLIKNYKFYKGKYGSFKAASDAATDRVQKNLTNRFISPSDYGIGGAAGVAASIGAGLSPQTALVGLGAAAANKFARERGSALAARSADTILKAFKSEGVQGMLQAAKPIMDQLRKGNPAAVATFQILKKSDPRVVEILNEQSAMQRRAGER